jgi:quinoprotein glucose dehydrogenase
MKISFLGAALALLGAQAMAADPGAAGSDWAYYHGNPGGTHYSSLDQITTANVKRLAVAWTYDTGDAAGGGVAGADMQVNPLVVDGKLYLVSPKGRVISLDAATGRERWVFDPAGGKPVLSRQRLRGVSYWTDGTQRRILATFRNHLLAIDADSGRLIESFGDAGRVDLRAGLGRDPATLSVSNVSPGVVYRDLIIMGGTGNAPGHIRAYDVRTGAMRWIFHTIPHPGETGYDSWPKDAWKTAMGVNNWAGMALDAERGTVFIPLASAGMNDKDFYGADRHGDNLFGSSLVALDAATGKRLWHFQSARHDLWDRDLPAPPTLVSVQRDGKRIDAVAQTTKSGFVYVFDRTSGVPLFPIDDIDTPPSDVPGEQAASSQPVPLRPAPFARQQLDAASLTRRTPQAHAAVAATFATLRNRGRFDPPSEQGTIIFPGLDGGAEWGGAAFDPQTGLLYVNANEMAWILKLKKRPPPTPGSSGRAVYLNNCAACHREDRSGSPPEFPSLVGVGERLPEMEMLLTIQQGSGRMPAFGALGRDQVKAVIGYLRGSESEAPASAEAASGVAAAAPAAPYVFDGYKKFLDPDGYPAIAPPWGTLSAINLNTGDYAWKIPFGAYPALAASGGKATGSENYGGAVVTAGGLLFIGATVYDNRFHAFDKRTGKLLWQDTLPAAGLATPATYLAGGRQFVVIAAGGGKNPKAAAAAKLVAYALPRQP